MGIKSKIKAEGNAYFSAQVPDISEKLFGQIPMMDVPKRTPFFLKRLWVPMSAVSVLATSAIVVAVVLASSGPHYRGLTPLNDVNFAALAQDEGASLPGTPVDYTYIHPFAVDSIQALYDETKNMVYSPLSAYLALASLLEATNNESYTELADALHVGQMTLLRQYMNAYMHELNFEYKDTISNKEQKTISKVANAVFVNQAYEVEKPYVDTLANHYLTEAFHTTFSSSSRQGIADWINGKTNHFLDVKPGDIRFSSDTIFALYNTLYSKFYWQNPYQKSNTMKSTFTNTVDENIQSVDFMGKTFFPTFAEKTSKYIHVVDDIRHGMSMHIVMPKEGYKVADILLDNALLNGILVPKDDDSNLPVSLLLPKFSLKNTINLVPMMRALGVNDIFTPFIADLSKATNDAYVGSIMQNTGIVVDEKGIEAASFTEINVPENTAPVDQQIEVFNINRSFLYIISTDQGIPLYLGVNHSIS